MHPAALLYTLSTQAFCSTALHAEHTGTLQHCSTCWAHRHAAALLYMLSTQASCSTALYA